MITERDLRVLELLYRYYVLSRSQIQRVCFPEDKDGRVTRRRLQMLVGGHFVRRLPLLLTPPQVSSPSSTGSVYYPTQRGLDVLAEYYDEPRFLSGTTRAPQIHRLFHWLAVSETHLMLDSALHGLSAVSCPAWYNEWDVVNQDESAPQARFRLYVLLDEKPRLVCAPDAAFLLDVAGIRKAFYLEQDRNTSGVGQIAASKTKGYAELAARMLHRKHFPDETAGSFSVLLIAPTDRRRDALRKAFRDKPGARLWRFAAEPDITAEKFLFAPIFFPCEGEATPLIKSSALAAAEIQSSIVAEILPQ